jgi:protein-S-isoprenylcysteine O-methyltransferase Ste14
MLTFPRSAARKLAAYGARIFAFRLVLGLIVAAIGIELLVPTPPFAEGYRALHLCGVLLVVIGLSIRAWGAASAGDHTRSASIEAAQLVTEGAFAYVRNPIYAGSILLGIGMSCLISDPLAFALTAMTFALLYFGIIPAEERFLRKEFGSQYEAYCDSVPRLIPRFRPRTRTSGRPFRWKAARGELFIAAILISIYAALWFEEYLDQISWL